MINYDYIVKEVFEPDFSMYFDCDCYSSAAGNYNYNVFCITNDRRGYCNHYTSGINEKEFKYITDDIDAITDELDDIINGFSTGYKNVKELMKDYDIEYNPRAAHEFKNLLELDFVDSVCLYLTLKTGKKWDSIGVCGYCQGDYVNVIYCEDYYNEKSARIIGELYMGCGKEFSITFLNEAGEENNTVYGYYVADCEYMNDSELKSIVCGMEGIDPEKAQFELIENVSTIYSPTYKVI